MAAPNIVTVTDSSFEAEVIKATQPVLVDFWAEWCGPCKALAPIVDELAGEYAGRIKVAKLDVETNQNVPAQYGIRGIPTLLLFKNGQVTEQIVGLRSKRDIKSRLDQLVAPS